MSSSHRVAQLIDEYTGPIGLYAYLAQRSKVAPIILRRNLCYRRDAYETERRRINAEVNGKPSVAAAKSDKDAVQEDCKERAADRAPDVHDAADGNGSKRDGAEEPTHSAASRAGGVGGKRAPDGEQPCSRRSMHAVKRTAVVLRLRYQEGQQESVHRLPELRCPWCDMTCAELESLMWHLQASHDRFSYALDKSLTIPEIYINVKGSSATEELSKSLLPHTDFCFLSARRGGGSLSASLSHLLACEDEALDKADDAANKKRKKSNEGGSSINSKGKQPTGLQTKGFSKSKNGKGKKGARMAGERKYLSERHLFRSQTCLPIDVEDEMDMDYDSDDDVDDEWQLAQAERLMDEFEDVTSKEKAFMKLWNRFLHRHAILSDFQVAVACETFARHYGAEMWREGLRDELLFHMFALWDFNLVDQSHIMASIAHVDKYGHEAEANAQAPPSAPSASTNTSASAAEHPSSSRAAAAATTQAKASADSNGKSADSSAK